MAAITPTSVTRDSLGSLSLVRAVFSTADDGDTWASGLTGILDKYTNDNTNPATQASVGVAVTESSGTFTFHPAENGTAFTLFVFLRS